MPAPLATLGYLRTVTCPVSTKEQRRPPPSHSHSPPSLSHLPRTRTRTRPSAQSSLSSRLPAIFRVNSFGRIPYSSLALDAPLILQRKAPGLEQTESTYKHCYTGLSRNKSNKKVRQRRYSSILLSYFSPSFIPLLLLLTLILILRAANIFLLHFLYLVLLNQEVHTTHCQYLLSP